MVFPRQEYRSGLPFPSPGDLLNPGIELIFPALAGELFTTEATREDQVYMCVCMCVCVCVCVYMCVYIYTHTHIHTNIYSYIHTFIHHWDRGKEL